MDDQAALPTIEDLGGTQHRLIRPDGAAIRWAGFQQPEARGSVLFLPGFTEFIEKHLETVGDLRRRRFCVLTLDWRGQGLSDRSLADPHKGDIASMDLFLEDLDAVLAAAGFADWPAPRIIVGHSMGGHLGLRFIHDRPDLFDRIVALAPMAGIAMSTLMRTLAQPLAWSFQRLGFAEAYAPGAGGPYGERRRTFEGNPLTHDEGRFRRIHRYIDRDPRLALGAPTIRWLNAAFRSMALAHDPAFVREIRRPVLLALAGRESIVSNTAIRRLAGLLPDCRLLRLDDARHELLLETDAVRRHLWQEIDRFLGIDTP